MNRKPRPVVLYDVTRLFMRASGGSPTGIDRVNEAYARWLLSRDDIEVAPVCAWRDTLETVTKATFEDVLNRRGSRPVETGGSWPLLVDALTDPARASPVLRARAAESAAVSLAKSRSDMARRYVAARLRTLKNRRPTPNVAGAIYLNVSHYGLEQRRLLEGLRRRGVRPMAMIHDLIPIEHPEYCSPSALVWHRRRVDAVLRHCDLVITNSVSTSEVLANHAERHGLRTPPICAAPLGLEPKFLDDRPEPLLALPYFVCVGTIEPRKNLTFLLTLWRRLADRMGGDTPMLVLAGQRGWENESVIDHLDRSPPIRRFVHEVRGLADGHLAALIGGARALLSPSFSEGFNLPVAEALAAGTPVIASDIAVHRELAAGAQLIDPIDGPQWLAAIEAATRERPATRPTRHLGWPEHFAIVAHAMGLN